MVDYSVRRAVQTNINIIKTFAWQTHTHSTYTYTGSKKIEWKQRMNVATAAIVYMLVQIELEAILRIYSYMALAFRLYV